MLVVGANFYNNWAHTLSCVLFLTYQVRIQPLCHTATPLIWAQASLEGGTEICCGMPCSWQVLQKESKLATLHCSSSAKEQAKAAN